MKCDCNGKAIYVNVDSVKYVEIVEYKTVPNKTYVHFIDGTKLEVSDESGIALARMLKARLHPTVKVKE